MQVSSPPNWPTQPPGPPVAGPYPPAPPYTPGAYPTAYAHDASYGYGQQPVRRDPRRWGMGDVAYGLLTFFGGQVAATLLAVVLGLIDLDTSAGTVDLDLSVPVIMLTVAAGWVGLVGWPLLCTYRKGQRSLAKDFGFAITGGDVGWGVLGGLAALAISVAANVLWIVASGDEPPSNAGFLPDQPSVFEGLLLFLAVAVGTPVAEELFFRGLFLRAAAKRWGVRVGLIASTAVFGLMHLQTFDVHGVFIVFVTGLYGGVFALLAVWRDRIGASIVAHMVVNGTGVLTLFFASGL